MDFGFAVTNLTNPCGRRYYNFLGMETIGGKGKGATWMPQELAVLKDGDWSLDLEGAYFEEHPEDVFVECVKAIRRTKAGRCVNLVTPGSLGDPRDWLIPQLIALVKYECLNVREIRYIDQRACGGHVTRVFR